MSSIRKVYKKYRGIEELSNFFKCDKNTIVNLWEESSSDCSCSPPPSPIRFRSASSSTDEEEENHISRSIPGRIHIFIYFRKFSIYNLKSQSIIPSNNSKMNHYNDSKANNSAALPPLSPSKAKKIILRRPKTLAIPPPLSQPQNKIVKSPSAMATSNYGYEEPKLAPFINGKDFSEDKIFDLEEIKAQLPLKDTISESELNFILKNAPASDHNSRFYSNSGQSDQEIFDQSYDHKILEENDMVHEMPIKNENFKEEAPSESKYGPKTYENNEMKPDQNQQLQLTLDQILRSVRQMVSILRSLESHQVYNKRAYRKHF